MNLLTFPSPLLKRKTQYVYFGNDETLDYLKHNENDVEGMKALLATMPNALALAANQVGLRERLFVIQPEFARSFGLPEVVFNPQWSVLRDETYTDNEGCLSFPGLNLDIERYWTVDCSFDSLDKKTEMLCKTVMTLDGLVARMFQHECEHLDGETFLENLPRIQRYQVAAEFRKRKGA